MDNKNFSERIVTTPVSALGQKTFLKSHHATSITLPSTLINDPKRKHLPANEEQPIADYHGYMFVTDLREGLIVADVATLLDGNPANNFIRKAAFYNPDGALDGARHAWMAGQWLYITTARGLAVVDAADPEKPVMVGGYAGPFLSDARQSTIQWNYCFVTDAEGVKAFDISNPASPQPISGASVGLSQANGLYAARTYLYVANGSQDLAIIDIKNPEKPRKLSDFTAGGRINDARDVQIGSVSASMYAHVADGRNGLRVVQMISPENVPGHMGFSPKPEPKLIATYPTKDPAVTVSRGLDRDRVVDESGNQTVAFGRRGARPFNLDEMEDFFRNQSGEIYRVYDVKHGENGSLTNTRQRDLSPTDIVPHPEDGFTICESFGNALFRLSAGGHVSLYAGGPGANPKSLSHPHSAVCDEDGNVYVADTFNQELRLIIEKFRTSIERIDGTNHLTITWDSLPGRTYQLQILGNDGWVDTPPAPIVATAEEASATFPMPQQSTGLYRVLLLNF